MNGLESSTASSDRTEDPEFLDGHMDRLLAWEYVHTFLCAGKPLYPSRIADRIGVPTATVHDILNNVGDSTQNSKSG